MQQANHILKKHSLRKTDTRAHILRIFLSQEAALSEPELEKAIAGACDRVTIYRTLTTFLEKGILHKVPDDSGVMKYAMCPDECGESHEHEHDHVHFKCGTCGRTLCVDEVPIPDFSLPKGFQLQSVNMLLKGVCANCSGAA